MSGARGTRNRPHSSPQAVSADRIKAGEILKPFASKRSKTGLTAWTTPRRHDGANGSTELEAEFTGHRPPGALVDQQQAWAIEIHGCANHAGFAIVEFGVLGLSPSIRHDRQPTRAQSLEDLGFPRPVASGSHLVAHNVGHPQLAK